MAYQITNYAWKSYLRWTLSACFLAIASTGLLNTLTDPLGVFGTPRLPGINSIKPYPDHHGHLSRFTAGRRICANTGIFGNSRAEIGFDPLSPAFLEHGIDAFNHAIPGSNAGTAYRQLLWLEASGCMPRQIFLGVEFFDFLGGSPSAPLPTLRSDPPPTLDGRFFAEAVFSITGVRDSLSTLIAQQSDFAATLTERGFNPLNNYLQEVNRNGHHVLFRQRAEENLRNWSAKPKRLRPADGAISEDEMVLDAILTRSTLAGSRTYLIIYPYHAQIRLLMARTGMGSLFSEWKQQVYRIAERQAAQGGNVEVWDFSGIGNETLEAIPGPGDRRTHLSYFWEAGHFKKELGEKVIARVLGHDTGFGKKLESRTLESWLEQDRENVAALLAKPGPLVAEIDDLSAGLATGR